MRPDLCGASAEKYEVLDEPSLACSFDDYHICTFSVFSFAFVIYSHFLGVSHFMPIHKTANGLIGAANSTSHRCSSLFSHLSKYNCTYNRRSSTDKLWSIFISPAYRICRYLHTTRKFTHHSHSIPHPPALDQPC